MAQFKRTVMASDVQNDIVAILQSNLVDLIDLALQLKQAHWNVVGPNFRSLHQQFDDILETVREGSDECAERLVALGSAADGRAATVASATRLTGYPHGFQSVSHSLSSIADRLAKCVEGLRASIEQLAALDPVSEDLLIGLSAQLEKHLWMLQAQEVV